MAKSNDDLPFVASFSESVRSHFNPKGGVNSLIILKSFDEGRNDFEGQFDEQSIKNFIQLHRNPVVAEFDEYIA